MLNELHDLGVTDATAGDKVVVDVVEVVSAQLSKVVERLAVEVAAEADHPLEVSANGLEGHGQAPELHIDPEEPATREVDL